MIDVLNMSLKKEYLPAEFLENQGILISGGIESQKLGRLKSGW